ncbi:MAG: FAD-linked oxidase C-terminal domain-containing protein, partial [Candidatus Dormibacteria bacterium]
AADTIEVAALWAHVETLHDAVAAALAPHCMAVGCHCSHAYETGCALYFTFVLQAEDREAALAKAWSAALDATVAAGGTITHHHGVGQLKRAWLEAELDGFAPYLSRVQRAFDPLCTLNPSTLRT